MADDNTVMKTKIAVSIIIPHYNSPETLERLIDSIGVHDDIQIIVVDDNSTKGQDYLKKLEDKYQNIAEFYKNTSGVQSAGACRNIGIEEAKGTWILFADADDFFTEQWYGIVMKYFDTDYDAVYFTPTSSLDDGCTVGERHVWQQMIMSEYINSPCRESYMQLARIDSIWSNLIRRDVIIDNKCQCSETMHANDALFSKKIFYYCQNKKITSEVIYCVTHTAGSLSTIKTEQAFFERLDEYVKCYKFLEKHFEKIDFDHIRMNGGWILYDAYKGKIGIGKILIGYGVLKKNSIRIVAKENMPLIRFLRIQ